VRTKLIVLIIISLFTISCNKTEKQNDSDDLKKKELELKEKDLQLKEKELLEKKEATLNEKEKRIEQNSQGNDQGFSLSKKEYENNINANPPESAPPPKIRKYDFDISGSYWGSIKDGTRWYVFISNNNGGDFKGYDIVNWKSTPDGLKTKFTGTYDSQSGQVIIYEDKNAKGSGKFIGTVSDNGNKMNGVWYRYTDKGFFTWNLEKTDEVMQ